LNVGPADRGPLRRVYLDLIGLPPTIGRREVFSRTNLADAYEKGFDQLLASESTDALCPALVDVLRTRCESE